MIIWQTDEDERGLPVWHRYVNFSHWGLVLTGTFPRWMIRDPAFCDTFYTAGAAGLPVQADVGRSI